MQTLTFQTRFSLEAITTFCTNHNTAFAMKTDPPILRVALDGRLATALHAHNYVTLQHTQFSCQSHRIIILNGLNLALSPSILPTSTENHVVNGMAVCHAMQLLSFTKQRPLNAHSLNVLCTSKCTTCAIARLAPCKLLVQKTNPICYCDGRTYTYIIRMELWIRI